MGVGGYDASERITGRKRGIVTDTTGLLVRLEVQSDGIQDHNDGSDVLLAVAVRYSMLRHILTDGGHAGPALRDALKAIGRRAVQIVKRSDIAKGFSILPRQCAVGRPPLSGLLPPGFKSERYLGAGTREDERWHARRSGRHP